MKSLIPRTPVSSLKVVEMLVVKNWRQQPTQMLPFLRQRIIKTRLERFCTLEAIKTQRAVLGIALGPRKTRLAYRVFHHCKVSFNIFIHLLQEQIVATTKNKRERALIVEYR